MPTTVRFTTPREQVDDAEEALWALGAHAVTLCDAGDDPVHEPGPGETPLWSSARIEALLPDDLPPEPVLTELARRGIVATPSDAELSDVPDQAWERTWMDRFEPMRFGEGIWICPWHVEPDPGWPVVVRLDPGLAFGTGTHPTTALCLEWLDSHDLDGRDVIDYGCGSGVLAIAAALKGARRVVAVDHDPQALEATRENAERNGVAARIETRLPRPEDRPRADLVLANILAGPLVELAPMLAGRVRPGGWLILSGILETQFEAVDAAYRERIAPAGEAQREEWLRLDYRRPA